MLPLVGKQLFSHKSTATLVVTVNVSKEIVGFVPQPYLSKMRVFWDFGPKAQQFT